MKYLKYYTLNIVTIIFWLFVPEGGVIEVWKVTKSTNMYRENEIKDDEKVP